MPSRPKHKPKRLPDRASRIPKKVVEAVASPVQRFIATESSSGIVLILAALAAFAWANSPWAGAYLQMLETGVGIGLGGWRLEMTLQHWVNDLLMALFFFLVGLEIKRELLIGELAGWQRAALPVAGALGGMVVPALIYVAFNAGEDTVRGWGVPMATDIAFALGVLALLGERVPLSLKVFLLALAIVDDLGAVLVIALFYTENLDTTALLVSLAIWGGALFYGRAEGHRGVVFALIGGIVWYFMLRSGVHATIAGVLMALAVPARHRMSTDELRRELQWTAGATFEDIEARIQHLEGVIDQAHSPLHAMEHDLGPYVAFLVMPVFAFFNAGVALGGRELDLLSAVTMGAFLGLLIGKPIGVVAFVWLAVRTGISQLPKDGGWMGFAGIGLLAGIGFTMSLFVANLAFGEGALLDQAKIGVLAASLVAALAGLGFLHVALPGRKRAGVNGPAARPADAG
jgi:Na+:H+ antiporter, NhaA family